MKPPTVIQGEHRVSEPACLSLVSNHPTHSPSLGNQGSHWSVQTGRGGKLLSEKVRREKTGEGRPEKEPQPR